MNMQWWQLPGPDAFVHSVYESLIMGRNTLVFLPEHAPTGLREALQERFVATRRYLEDCKVVPWCQVDVAEQLIKRYLPNHDPELRWDANSLAKSDDFAGQLLWVEIREKPQWLRWSKFIESYAHACRQRDSFDRTLFIIMLHGIAPPVRPLEDVFLSQHEWRSCIDYFDVLLYCANLLPSNGASALERQLRCALIANLALWDAALVQDLVHLPLRELLAPDNVLLDVAKSRKWDGLEPSAFTWENGILNSLRNDAECIHTAAVAMQDPAHEMEERIWRAQVGILFPYVETQRRRLLAELDDVLQIPWTRQDGESIMCLDKLEIGDIAAQLNRRGSKFNSVIASRARQLAAVRNNLAHLRHLDYASLVSVVQMYR